MDSRNVVKIMFHTALVVVSLMVAVPASAQIYTWRDANGNLVLSNRRSDETVRTYAVPQASAVRTTRPPPSLTRRLEYDDLITEHARLNRVRPDLVRAVIQVESGYNVYARSAKGALGLMQLMPATAQQFGVRNPYNPIENVRAGVAYLRHLLDRYENNEQLALAAYNAGPAAVDRHGQSVPPFRETKNYVARINQMAGSRPITVRGKQIYKTIQIVDGRPVSRYSDRRPVDGEYVVVGR